MHLKIEKKTLVTTESRIKYITDNGYLIAVLTYCDSHSAVFFIHKENVFVKKI